MHYPAELPVTPLLLPPHATVGAKQGGTTLAFGLGLEQIGQAFSLGQVDPAIVERAPGEFARRGGGSAFPVSRSATAKAAGPLVRMTATPAGGCPLDSAAMVSSPRSCITLAPSGEHRAQAD